MIVGPLYYLKLLFTSITIRSPTQSPRILIFVWQQKLDGGRMPLFPADSDVSDVQMTFVTNILIGQDLWRLKGRWEAPTYYWAIIRGKSYLLVTENTQHLLHNSWFYYTIIK